MLSMNGIIICELILGAVLMSLVFTTLADTELIAGSAPKSNHEPLSESAKQMEKPAPAQAEQ